jgi:hypothetical protein
MSLINKNKEGSRTQANDRIKEALAEESNERSE